MCAHDYWMASSTNPFVAASLKEAPPLVNITHRPRNVYSAPPSNLDRQLHSNSHTAKELLGIFNHKRPRLLYIEHLLRTLARRSSAAHN